MPKIYVIGFYLLTWVYFNDVNVGRNTVINSQLKRILLLAAASKSETKLREAEKKIKKENTNETTFSESERPDFNSLRIWTKSKHQILTIVAVIMWKKVLKIK